MSDLVTGEAVVLGLRPAKLPSRIVAVAIDLALWWGGYLVVSMALITATASLDEAAGAAVDIATLLFLLVGLPIAVETLSRGRSLGKLVCGLRVLRDDGGPIRFRHALVRGAVGAVEIQLTMGVVACVASLVSARGRRLGDLFAGTLVVRERVPAQYLQQPAPPPWLAGQLAGVDLSGLPDGLWLAVRQYLARMGQLDPQVGWSMAQRLAGDVAARTGMPVPEGVPPAAYLAAVVAERQAREAHRAFGGGPGLAGAAPGAGGMAGAPPGPGASPVTGTAPVTGSAPASGWAAPGAHDRSPAEPTAPVRPQPGAAGPVPAGPSRVEAATGFAPPA